MPASPEANPRIVEPWSRLSYSSRRAFTLAQTIAADLGASQIEMAPMLYGVFHPTGGHQHDELEQAGAQIEMLRGALGLEALSGDPQLPTGEPADTAPAVAPHVEQGLLRADEDGRHNQDTITHSRNLLEGMLRVRECSTVAKLLDTYDFSFMGPEFAPAATPTAAVTGWVDHVATSLLRTPTLRVVVRQTRAPWALPADAFVLPTDLEGRPGRLADALAKAAGEVGQATVRDLLTGSASALDADTPRLLDTDRLLVTATGAAARHFVATSFEGSAATAAAATSATRALIVSADAARLGRLTMPILGTGHGGLALHDGATALVAALSNLPPLEHLHTLIVSTFHEDETEALRGAADAFRFQSLSNATRQVVKRATVGAILGDLA